MQLIPLIEQNAHLFLLVAPPAWGKTYLLRQLMADRRGRWIYISPLRALANEFYDKMIKYYPSYIIRKRSELADQGHDFFNNPHSLLVLTAETIHQDLYVYLEHIHQKPILVFDEFHLFYDWGQGFRPILWETFINLSLFNCPMMGLTATMHDELKQSLNQEILLGFDFITILNIGNMCLKNYPEKINYYPVVFSERVFQQRFHFELLRTPGYTCLYFCQYRGQVDVMVKKYRSLGFNVLGCKGGEVTKFCDELKKNPDPQCIFTTIALSHGVNLPRVSKVFLSYQVHNYALWLQMVGRGGRQGESYALFTRENYLDHHFKKPLQIVITWLWKIRLSWI